MGDATDPLTLKIEEILKARRANYTDFAGVSDGTCVALSSWVMDPIREDVRFFKDGAPPDPIADILAVTDTSRVFTESNVNYSKGHETEPNAYNRIFIQCQQNYLTERLRARGHVFLNDAYETLGFEETRAGALLGWLHKSSDPDFVVNGFIDVGLYSEVNQAFIDGVTTDLKLIFNIDGLIFDKI